MNRRSFLSAALGAVATIAALRAQTVTALFEEAPPYFMNPYWTQTFVWWREWVTAEELILKRRISDGR